MKHGLPYDPVNPIVKALWEIRENLNFREIQLDLECENWDGWIEKIGAL